MINECRGCVIHGLSEEQRFDFPLKEGRCPGRLDIFVNKCPCKTCLVKVTCRDGCEEFNKNSIDLEDR